MYSHCLFRNSIRPPGRIPGPFFDDGYIRQLVDLVREAAVSHFNDPIGVGRAVPMGGTPVKIRASV